jgi:hypothetical protein
MNPDKEMAFITVDAPSILRFMTVETRALRRITDRLQIRADPTYNL